MRKVAVCCIWARTRSWSNKAPLYHPGTDGRTAVAYSRELVRRRVADSRVTDAKLGSASPQTFHGNIRRLCCRLHAVQSTHTCSPTDTSRHRPSILHGSSYYLASDFLFDAPPGHQVAPKRERGAERCIVVSNFLTPHWHRLRPFGAVKVQERNKNHE